MNKIAVVTGGASGIGQSVAEHLVRNDTKCQGESRCAVVPTSICQGNSKVKMSG